MLILYGSETGAAQDVAEVLWRCARERGISSRVLAMDDYSIQMLPEEKFVVFVVATSGQGDLPTNMRTNWRRLLLRQLPGDLLSKVKTAVFGLGDSSYQKFNFASKKLFRRLVQLGASPILELGLADDQHSLGVDGALEPWMYSLWSKLYEMNLFEGMSLEPSYGMPSKYHLYDDQMNGCASSSYEALSQPSSSSFCEVEVLSNQRLTHEDHFQDTRLITFSTLNGNNGCKIDGSFLRYKPGDVLMVHPCNLPGTVNIAIVALQLSDEVLDKSFLIRPSDENIAAPPEWLISGSTTIRFCLESYFDLQIIPRRSFLALLSNFSSNSMEKERLAELASAEGLDDYLDYCRMPRRTVAELLRDFPATSECLKPEQLFDVLPTIRARAFSIASSPSAHPLQLQLLVARVVYKAKRMVEQRRGLCSNFLCDAKTGDKVFVRARPGTFAFSLDQQPLLLVGPGTGVAPFRSIISENESQIQSPSRILLFFGCRSAEKDFYFNKEFSACKSLSLVTAFSRDQPSKVYVQHKIGERSKEVWEYLQDENARILIAGSANEMPKAVLSALKRVAAENGVVDTEELLDRLERRNRIQFETWS